MILKRTRDYDGMGEKNGVFVSSKTLTTPLNGERAF